MFYLVKKGRRARKNAVAHLWDGQDTICRLFSTGGLNDKFYQTAMSREHLDPEGKKIELPVCKLCSRR